MRPHAERIREDLDEIRADLERELRRIEPDRWDWAPGPGMKSFRALILEIAAIERLTLAVLQEASPPEWSDPLYEATEASLNWTGSDVEGALAAVTAVRAETLAYLDQVTETDLQTSRTLRPDWQAFFARGELEPEEMLRWIVRHEYYHLGQIVTYRWILGDNPYER